MKKVWWFLLGLMSPASIILVIKKIIYFGPRFNAKEAEDNNACVRAFRRTKQFKCLLAIVGLQAGVPIFVGELYPFSAATMFAYPLHQVATYEVVTPAGETLGARSFGLQINNPHDPPLMTMGRYGYGRALPSTIQQTGSAPYGNIASEQELTRHVQSRLLNMTDLPYVTVTQSVLGPRDKHQVGITQRKSFKIMNPANTRP